jgi:hypothetical protein
MINLIFIIIILYIILQQFFELKSTEPFCVPDIKNKFEIETPKIKEHFNTSQQYIVEDKYYDFDKPNPWTKVIYKQNDEYPYYYYIRINIPSLNDFEVWKQIVPNLDLDQKSHELIIPSKDEASALALANLMLNNFTGQLTLSDILEKNLIQVSISKAQNYDVVQNKLREQINDNLYGKNIIKPTYNTDTATTTVDRNALNIPKNSSKIDFTDTSFADTFEHFDDNNKKESGIQPFASCDYSTF